MNPVDVTTPVLAPTQSAVLPSSGRRESLAVLALVVAILAGSAGVIALHRQDSDIVALPEWQIDLRSGLNAAEQGITADLLTAAPEIPFLPDSRVETLAAEGLPPFTTDAASAVRGGHLWQKIEAADRQAWLGLPAQTDLARPMLLRLEGDAPTVWIAASPAATGDLSDASLIASGWQMVATRYDASVTRRDVH
ncbi:DUF6162 family protein [Paracoccus aminophilus]|uniref:Uncharacterized protein n=1 Tax=Paracoccus aminophilus JCM 7686 TaxID=1367847 RepID=S5YB18_PARAH|nr:DUF6162 family protein [Paracoccus aminophilus]AGT08613.1 hypothetical protein JCM7686_1512 [Paracoccus aminophilus JCM 7686]